MTDVRDPDSKIELDEARLDIAPRRSLVARALAPIRRRADQDLPSGRTDLSDTLQVALEPKSRIGIAIVVSLLLVVVVPILASGIYLFAFATNQYVAEARFAVRKAQPPQLDGEGGGGGDSGQAGSVTSLLSGAPGLVGEDAYIIANYIHSRAIVDDVSQMLDLRSIFRRPEADFWARLSRHAEAEVLTRYWNSMVSVYVESSSGIVMVSARAFRREDALALTRAVLTASEKLANSLTLKLRADQTRLAEDEVRRSESSVRFALADLTAFRNAQHMIDPVDSSRSTGTLLVQLMSDRIATEGQVYVMQRSQGPNAPGMASLKARLESINQHIAELQDQLAGDKKVSQNMAATMSRFEELELKKGFAEKMFEFARKGLERAQLTAMGQSIYLAVFMPPSLPQDFSYPERFTDLFLVALAAAMTWISGATITASILDHRL